MTFISRAFSGHSYARYLIKSAARSAINAATDAFWVVCAFRISCVDRLFAEGHFFRTAFVPVLPRSETNAEIPEALRELISPRTASTLERGVALFKGDRAGCVPAQIKI
jgi:peptidoglycan biosynthesis protein MviN/MurJ (putative lipid II flippase)